MLIALERSVEVEILSGHLIALFDRIAVCILPVMEVVAGPDRFQTYGYYWLIVSYGAAAQLGGAVHPVHREALGSLYAYHYNILFRSYGVFIHDFQVAEIAILKSFQSKVPLLVQH